MHVEPRPLGTIHAVPMLVIVKSIAHHVDSLKPVSCLMSLEKAFSYLQRRTSRHRTCNFNSALCRDESLEDAMNQDTLKGQWTQLKGQVREQWGKLTNDDLDQIQGRSEQLVGRIQERYGIARDEAERQVDAWDPAARRVV